MFFDALTIAAARDEMLEKLIPGRVQQVRAIGPLAIALEVYSNHRRRYLLLSAHPQYARAHILSGAPSRDPGVRSPFLLLLRKYIRGAVLQSIDQPDFERVLVFNFTKVLPTNADQTALEDEAEDAPEINSDDPRADIPPGFALFETRIIAEIMGRHSNIILVDQDNIVRDSIKRIPSSINRVRTILPRMPYVGPPAQRKLNVLSMNGRGFEGEMLDLDPKTGLWQALVARFRSVSPLLAQEAVFRAGGNSMSKVAEVAPGPMYAALCGLLSIAETAEWEPSLAWSREEDEEQGGERGAGSREPGDSIQSPNGVSESKPDENQIPELENSQESPGSRLPAPDSSRAALAFAPYPLLHLQAGEAELQEVVSISRAAELFYAAVEQVSDHAQLKADILAEIRERQDRLERRVRSMKLELDRAAGFEKQRHNGELLLAYMYSIKPGQKTLEVPEENLSIALNPDSTPLEQAQGMFREYQRARAAVAGVPARIEATELGLRYLDELTTALDIVQDFDAIQTVRADVAAMPSDPDSLGSWTTGAESRDMGAAQKKSLKDKRADKQNKKHQPNRNKEQSRTPATRGSGAGIHPVQVKSRDGLLIMYGRSARENDALTFGLARPGDLWLHARGVPGSHVVIRGEGRDVPESTVVEAARLAARNSKARNDNAVDVMIAERRNVRRVPGAPPGLVTVNGERVLRVRIDNKEEQA